MSGGSAPVFRKLGQRECERILKRNHVGRMAFALRSRVEIEPLGYVKVGAWLFGRTSPGTKLQVIGHQPWVAFEVDEVEGVFDWQSVVVHGVCRQLHDEGTSLDRRTYRRALAAVRKVIPETFTETDPAPHRSVVFGIHIDSVTGRAASSGG